MSLDKMLKSKLSLNKSRSLQVDFTHEQSSTSKNHMFIKCTIMKHQVHEQVDYFIFRSKLLIFTVNTRQAIGDNKKSWNVRRFETDFYTLRNILVLAFGQCLVPPLVPT